ncbi:MAG: hypothetical protein SGI89_10290 [bacterium]|nr:hypothetical protein [bacterium]
MKIKLQFNKAAAIKLLLITSLVIIINGHSYSQIDSIKVQPTGDNTLYEDVNGLLSNGKGDYMFSGKSPSGLLRRSVISFQLIEFIPPCSKILSVRLKIRVSGSAAVSKTIQLRKLNEFWGEGNSDAPGTEENGTLSLSFDATWKHRYFSSTAWLTTGGSYSGIVSASANVSGTGFYTWGSTAAMVSDVQSWVNDQSEAKGWILTGDEINNSSVKRFNTKDGDTASFYPELTVVYELNDYSLYLANLIEGFWDGTTMIEDTMKVSLRSSVSPYAVADSDKAFAGQYGARYCFYNITTGDYYISVNHRNSIETWSKYPINVQTGSSDYYNFSDSASKAYGDNQVLKLGSYCFYGGDQNQDDNIDVTDVVNIFNDVNNFVSGYVSSDVTGDDFVDSADLLIAFNNANNFVSIARP